MTHQVLRVGDTLYGFCGGEFGDSYEDKRVEAIGTDWVVARELNARGRVVFCSCESKDPEILLRYTVKEDNG